MDVKDLEQIMKAFDRSGIQKFYLRKGDFDLELEKGIKEAETIQEKVVESFTEQKVLKDNVVTKEFEGEAICSPLVGVFYSGPSSDEENYVKVGDRVKTGQVLGIIEAMKLMNEIECDRDGVITKIAVQAGTIVEYGQPLFYIQGE